MTRHALFGASSSKIWINCSEAARHLGKPGTTSVYAQEGTAAHTLAETCFAFGGDPKDLLGQKIDGFEVNGDMVDAVSVFTEYVGKLHKLGRFYYEQEVHLNTLFEDFEDGVPTPLFGTADVIHVYHETLTVIDYKHGAGVKVSASNNSQLLYYALGALFAFGKKKTKKIKMVIVQPRAFGEPISEVMVTVEALLSWGAHTLKPAIIKGIKGPWEFKSGEWCTFCKNAGNCEELHRVAQDVTRREFQKAPPMPQPKTGLTNEQLADVLTHRDLVRKFFTQAEAEATSRMQEGQDIPGFKMVSKMSRRVWQNEEIAEEILKDAGINPHALPPLKTPPAVEKEIGKATFAKRLGSFVTKGSSGHTIAPNSDPRTPVTSTAADDFENAKEV